MLIHRSFNFYLTLLVCSLLTGLGGCNDSQVAMTDSLCPSPPETPPPLQLSYEGDIYSSLQSVNISSHPNTLIFQSEQFNFIYCREQNQWIVQRGTYQKPNHYNQSEALVNPDYKTLYFNQKPYKYRVLLEPNPFSNFSVEPKQVIFELIVPEQSQPKRYPLYTLAQVREKTGFQLGVPQVTATQIDDISIYWAIASEQGEGFSGIATIVHYQPSTNDLKILQPNGLENQQIQDLALTGDSRNPTLWLATQMAGEGNPFLPGMGLVAYSSQSQQYKAYHIRNSPLVGVIPHRLKVDGDRLWVATGNGICHLQWKTPDRFNQWDCWQFQLRAKVPSTGLTLYPSSLSWEMQDFLPKETEEIEVLWWSMNDFHSKKGRYEVAYSKGIEVQFADQDSMAWSDYYASSQEGQSWQAPLYWQGKDWVWNGQQFVRPFDGVFLNLVGGGPSGFEKWNSEQHRSERYTIRGNLDLLRLTQNNTEVKHYSAWVEDSLLKPYVTLIPHQSPLQKQSNPLINKLR